MHMNPPKLSMFQVLACGAAIVTLSMGTRHGFGLWLLPITQEMGWTRQSFALAIALQNLSWGLIGIFAGMAADRFGAVVGAAGDANGDGTDEIGLYTSSLGGPRRMSLP